MILLYTVCISCYIDYVIRNSCFFWDFLSFSVRISQETPSRMPDIAQLRKETYLTCICGVTFSVLN